MPIPDPSEAETLMAMACGDQEANGKWYDVVQGAGFSPTSPGSGQVHVSSVAWRLEQAHTILKKAGMCRCSDTH